MIKILGSRLTKEEATKVKRNMCEELHEVHYPSNITKVLVSARMRGENMQHAHES